MSRTVERVIDLAATAVLLMFAWLLRESQPGLAGAVVMASISFWLGKNAEAPDSPAHKEAAAAIQAAATLATARVEATAAAAAEVIRVAAQVASDARAQAAVMPAREEPESSPPRDQR